MRRTPTLTGNNRNKCLPFCFILGVGVGVHVIVLAVMCMQFYLSLHVVISYHVYTLCQRNLILSN